jgi:hypothetical protein
VPRHPRKLFSTRARWPSDHRDELVAAALVGLVVVLLGYASGIGLGSNAASGDGSAIIAPGSPAPTGPSPFIVRATPGSGSGGYALGGGGGYGGYGGGGSIGGGPVAGSTGPAAPSASFAPTSPAASPTVVGSPPPASATASAAPTTATTGLGGVVDGLTGGLTSTVDTVLCGLLGVCASIS